MNSTKTPGGSLSAATRALASSTVACSQRPATLKVMASKRWPPSWVITIARVGGTMRATWPSGTGPNGLAIIRDDSELGPVALRFRQQHHDIDRAGAGIGLAHRGAGIIALHRIQHIAAFSGRWRPAPSGSSCSDRVGVPLCGLNCRSAMPGRARQGRHDLVGGGVQRIELVAEHLDGDIGGLAGQAFADAVAQEGDDFGLQPG